MSQEQLQLRRQFVSDHVAYDAAQYECRSRCEDMATRLELCLAGDSSIETKQCQLNELSSQCNVEGAERVQRVKDAAAVVLLSTSANGSNTINETVSELVTYWEALVDKISSARGKIEAELASCDELDASVMKLLQQLHDAEEERIRLAVPQSTLMEKLSCAQRSGVCFIFCTHFCTKKLSCSMSIVNAVFLNCYYGICCS